LREEGKLALSPWLPSRCLAKSFVLRRGSNFIFPAPISCLGDGYLPDAGESRERDEMSSLSGDWEVADRGPLIPLKPKGGLNGAPSIGCRWGGQIPLLRHDNDPLLNRDPGCFCPIADLQLSRDLFDVIADSELAYLQNSAYILVGQPF
jgi:hypothetical protein